MSPFRCQINVLKVSAMMTVMTVMVLETSPDHYFVLHYNVAIFIFPKKYTLTTYEITLYPRDCIHFSLCPSVPLVRFRHTITLRR